MHHRSFHIVNLGCAKNQVDAEVMASALEGTGWQWSEPESAEVILVNSCSFIEPAQVESIDTTFACIEDYPEARVVMTGCLSQRFGEQLAGEMPELAGLFGNRAPEQITTFLDRVTAGDGTGGPLLHLPAGDGPLTSARRTRLFSHPGSVYIKVAEGCDHRCTFCDIPNIRGGVRTRPAQSIVDEVLDHLDRGALEVNLVAQDLAAYDRPDAPALIRAILGASAERFWIRPLYVYPDAFPLDLVTLSREDDRLLPYFDIPMQHADPEVLRRMGRSGSAGAYLDLVDQIRRRNPAATIRTSIIVGFPGESEESVADLIDFVRAARIDWLGVFAYSPQAGTPAMRWVESGEMPDAEEVRRRREAVETAQQAVVSERLERFVGLHQTVLIEEIVRGSSMALARGPMHAPDVDGLIIVHGIDDTVGPGQMQEVIVRNVRGVDLNAHLTHR